MTSCGKLNTTKSVRNMKMKKNLSNISAQRYVSIIRGAYLNKEVVNKMK